jgi:hypothetical protein
MTRALLTLLLASAMPLSAAAQSARPVRIEAHPLFGDDLLVVDAENTILVALQNRRDRAISGELRVSVAHYTERPYDYSMRVDLPPRGSRQIPLEVFVPDGGTVNVRFEGEGIRPVETSVSPRYSPARRGLVLLTDPPHLRGQLHGITRIENDIGPYGSTRSVDVPVGTVTFDTRTGDPLLPLTVGGWAPVGFVLADVPDLARTSQAQRAAMRDWLRAGGQLVIFPRSDGDLRDPFVYELAGEIEVVRGQSTADQRALVPASAHGRFLRGPGAREEPFGLSKRFGYGRVFVVTYDATSPPQAHDPISRELVAAILAATPARGIDEPSLLLGHGRDDVANVAYAPNSTFGALRVALDPNEGYRPALVLVAFVLLLYVIVVGPVNFAFIGRRNRPLLALVTTPLAAIACLVIMLVVGYVGKGTTMRYRAAEVVEAREGDTEGIARRYTGLFFTRPAAYDLDAPERGTIRLIRSGSSDSNSLVDLGGAHPVIENVQGALWQTVFVREDRIAPLDGTISFERSGRAITAVVNGTRHRLGGAIVVDASGGVYRVGPIEPGGRAAIAASPSMTFDPSQAYYYAAPENGPMEQVAALLDLADEPKVVEGVMRVFGTVQTPPSPCLLAWTEVEREDDIAGAFESEFDYRFFRIVPDLTIGTRRASIEPLPEGGALDDVLTGGAAFDGLFGVDAGAPDAGGAR